MKTVSKLFILSILLYASFPAFSQKAESDTSVTCILNIDLDAGFYGGNERWNKYILKKLDQGIAKQNGAPVGTYTVNVQFLITREGSIDSVRALTNYGFGMEQEAVRVIQQAPKWSPAFKNNRSETQWKQKAITFTVSK